MRPSLDPATEHHLEEVSERLAADFSGIFSAETLARCVEESASRLGEVTVTNYVPLLPHRFARSV